MIKNIYYFLSNDLNASHLGFNNKTKRCICPSVSNNVIKQGIIGVCVFRCSYLVGISYRLTSKQPRSFSFTAQWFNVKWCVVMFGENSFRRNVTDNKCRITEYLPKVIYAYSAAQLTAYPLLFDKFNLTLFYSYMQFFKLYQAKQQIMVLYLAMSKKT